MTDDLKDEVARPSWPFDEKSVELGNQFLDRTAQITTPITLDFDTSSRVFVVVPLYRELKNTDELIRSWSSQILPQGESAEVIFLINNPDDADSDTVGENELTFNKLNEGLSDKPDSDASINRPRFHIVDKFSMGKALPKGTPIGDIRNVAISPIVAHAIGTGENCLVLSTDGDCFPSPNVLARLDSMFRMRGHVAGSIARKMEFAENFTPDDEAQIKKLMLLGNTERVLLDYLSYGEFEQPDIMAGSNTFYSLDAFLSVGGYTSDKDVSEDTDLSHKLRVQLQGDVARIEDVHVINMQRISDRLDGDGNFLTELQRGDGGGFYSPSNADSTIFQSQLRLWLIKAINEGASYNGGWAIDRVSEIIGNLPESARAELTMVVPTGSDESFDEDSYLAFYESVLDVLQEYGRFDLNNSIVSYGSLIRRVFGKSQHFMDICEKLSAEGENVDLIPLYALAEFAAENETNR